jgi:hypothetical protein
VIRPLEGPKLEDGTWRQTLATRMTRDCWGHHHLDLSGLDSAVVPTTTNKSRLLGCGALRSRGRTSEKPQRVDVVKLGGVLSQVFE